MSNYDSMLDRQMEEHFFGNENRANAYIRSIRNAAKKAYAEQYLAWVMDGRQGHNGPEWDRSKLSYMGAQAVRMNLDEFFPSEEI